MTREKQKNTQTSEKPTKKSILKGDKTELSAEELSEKIERTINWSILVGVFVSLINMYVIIFHNGRMLGAMNALLRTAPLHIGGAFHLTGWLTLLLWVGNLVLNVVLGFHHMITRKYNQFTMGLSIIYLAVNGAILIIQTGLVTVFQFFTAVFCFVSWFARYHKEPGAHETEKMEDDTKTNDDAHEEDHL
ncbi:MAG: hypothetical protein ACOX2M_03530 [Fastidiosipilaceae bacterium]|jgi:hypothetical protein